MKLKRETARMILRSGYPLRVKVNSKFNLTVRADIFSRKIYAKLESNGVTYPPVRMSALEALRFIKTNYKGT